MAYTDCTLTIRGSGSPFIYPSDPISISVSTDTSNGAQKIVVEGKNTFNI